MNQKNRAEKRFSFILYFYVYCLPYISYTCMYVYCIYYVIMIEREAIFTYSLDADLFSFAKFSYSSFDMRFFAPVSLRFGSVGPFSVYTRQFKVLLDCLSLSFCVHFLSSFIELYRIIEIIIELKGQLFSRWLFDRVSLSVSMCMCIFSSIEIDIVNPLYSVFHFFFFFSYIDYCFTIRKPIAIRKIYVYKKKVKWMELNECSEAICDFDTLFASCKCFFLSSIHLSLLHCAFHAYRSRFQRHNIKNKNVCIKHLLLEARARASLSVRAHFEQ